MIVGLSGSVPSSSRRLTYSKWNVQKCSDNAKGKHAIFLFSIYTYFSQSNHRWQMTLTHTMSCYYWKKRNISTEFTLLSAHRIMLNVVLRSRIDTCQYEIFRDECSSALENHRVSALDASNVT